MQLEVGDHIKVANEHTIVEVVSIVNELEGVEPYIRGWAVTGPPGRRIRGPFRAIALRRIERKVA